MIFLESDDKLISYIYYLYHYIIVIYNNIINLILNSYYKIINSTNTLLTLRLLFII